MINQSMGDVLFHEDKIIYFDNRMQALCECELQTQKARIIAVYIPVDGKEYIAHKIFKRESDYYMTSSCLPILLKYEGKTGEFKKFMPQRIGSDYGIGCYFFSFEQIIMIPQMTAKHPIQIFSLTENRFTENYKLMMQLSKTYSSEEFRSLRMYRHGEECWGAVYNSNHYFRYCISQGVYDGDLQIYELKQGEFHLDSAFYDGTNLWLTQCDTSEVICADNRGAHILEQESIPVAENKGEYSWIAALKNEIVVLPRSGNRIIVIDKATLKTSVITINADLLRGVKGTKSQWCQEYNHEIMIFPWNLKQILMVNRQRDAVKTYELCFDKKDVYEKISQRRGFSEDSVNGLFTDKQEKREFYSYLLSDKRKNKYVDRTQCAGDIVYKTLTSDMKI